MDKSYITLIGKGKKRAKNSFTKSKAISKTSEEEWVVGCLCLYTLYLPAPILMWPCGARVCPSGSSHHCGCCRGTGTHPNPTISRGAELPFPAPFLPRPTGTRCLAALLGEEEAAPASRGCLQSLPLLIAGPERLFRQHCLFSTRRKEEEVGGRHRRTRQLTAEHKSSTTDVAIPW